MTSFWSIAIRGRIQRLHPSSKWNAPQIFGGEFNITRRLLQCSHDIYPPATCRPISGCHAPVLARSSIRSYATCSSSRHEGKGALATRRSYPPSRRRHLKRSPQKPQTIITTYDHLPDDYKDEIGLDFREVPLSTQEVNSIFGIGFPTFGANKALKVIHGRRVAGTLADPTLGYCGDEYWNTGLAWLRANVPVDEEDSAAQRALEELAAMESDIVADGERLGLYKNPDGKDEARGHTSGSSVYGRSGLDEIQDVYKRRSEDSLEATKRAEQAAEVQRNTGTNISNSEQDRVGIELRRPGQNPRLLHYLQKAAATAPNIPPDVSAWWRLGGSAIVTLMVVGGSVLFAHVYVPPSHSTRLMQDIPPAAATILGIMAINLTVLVLWHVPPAFAPLNKYFLSVPGYPRAAAVLGSVFSHQTFPHLLSNMFILWIIGTRLHDDMGRANFLALYLSCGVIASFTSLSIFVLQKNFIHHSLGASGAICGIVGYYLWSHVNDQFRILNAFPPEPYSGIPGWLILGPLLCYELYVFRRGTMNFDHYAHLAGYATGISIAMYHHQTRIKREASIMDQQAKRIEAAAKGM